MLTVLVPVLALAAVAAWLTAVVSALRIAGLTPPGQRRTAWFELGLWRFASLRARAGTAVDPYLRRYVMGFVAFMLAVLAAMAVAVLATAPAAAAVPASAAVHTVSSSQEL